MKRLLSLATLIVTSAALLSADTLMLTNGKQVSGTFFGGDSRQIRFVDDDGRVQTFDVDEVERISFGSSTTAQAPSTKDAGLQNRSDRRRRGSSQMVPEGTPVAVRLIDSIDSDVTGAGERYRASLDEAIVVDGKEIVPRGADAMVEVARVEQAGKVSGAEEVSLRLYSLDFDGESYTTASSYAELRSKGQGKETAKKAAIGAGVGAIIGAIAGGGKGAAVGAGLGGGAGAAYSVFKGRRLEIPSESVIGFILEAPLEVR